MAATLALALAKIPEPALERAAYSAKPVHRAPEDAALTGLDRDWERRMAKRLARKVRCSLDDAEEAIDQELVLLIEKRRELFILDTDRWLGLLFMRGRYRLLKTHSAPPLYSIDAIEEALGDGAFPNSTLCVPDLPQAGEGAIDISSPAPVRNGSGCR